MTPYPRYSSVHWSVNDHLLIVKNDWLNQLSLNLKESEKKIYNEQDLHNFLERTSGLQSKSINTNFLIRDEHSDVLFLSLYNYSKHEL